MLRSRYAIMIDGGFATKVLNSRKRSNGDRSFTTADDIEQECERIQRLEWLTEYELLRIYYYDAPPLTGNVARPVTGRRWNLASTERFNHAQALYGRLKLKPNVALRFGETYLAENRWTLREEARKAVVRNQRELVDTDFELNVEQKGVDMRIGMDIARLALRDMVRAIVVVTADRDFVPAFKFARREGVRVILDPLGVNAAVQLKEHADIVI